MFGGTRDRGKILHKAAAPHILIVRSENYIIPDQRRVIDQQQLMLVGRKLAESLLLLRPTTNDDNDDDGIEDQLPHGEQEQFVW